MENVIKKEKKEIINENILDTNTNISYLGMKYPQNDCLDINTYIILQLAIQKNHKLDNLKYSIN